MIKCFFEDSVPVHLRHVVVDVLVLQGKQILLEKRAKPLKNAGKWGLPGGYLNRDETIAEGAKREVFEETGYRVENLKLLRIIDNPNRPQEDRQNVGFVYTASAAKKEGETDQESEEIKWFPLDKLPPQNQIAFDHFDSIQLFLKKHQ